MRKRTINTVVLALLLGLSLCAEDRGTGAGLFFGQSIGASHNPLGILTDTRFQYRVPLVPIAGLLWGSTKFEAGIQNEWTPADNAAMVRVALEPIAFFDVVLRAGYYCMFDGLGYGCFRMRTADQAYGPQSQNSADLTAESGYWLSATPTLKARVGRFIFVNSLTVNRISIGGDGYFLEVRSYLPHPVSGLDIIDDFYMLTEIDRSILCGVNYHYVRVNDTLVRSQRVGAAAVFREFRASALKGMYAAVGAGVYTDDPRFRNKPYIGGLAGWEVLCSPRSRERTDS